MVELFVGDVGGGENHLKRYDVLAVGLVRIVVVGNDVAQHDLDVCVWLLERFQFPHENCPVFVLFPYVVDAFAVADDLAGSVGSDVEDNSGF